MVDKYPTKELIGVVVEQNNNGKYYPKNQNITATDFHSWRIGKHTKGKLKMPGQIFLTENNQAVALIATKELAFKNRHNLTPMNRFLQASLEDPELQELHHLWERIQ